MQTIPFYILNAIITLFTLFLIFICLKSDSFKSIPCYFNIFFCFVIALDNGLRQIPIKDTKETIATPTPLCKYQGFFLAFFDKLFIATITIYSSINYIIMNHPKIYEKKMKLIYALLLVIYIIISLVLTLLDSGEGMSKSSLDHQFCYIKTSSVMKMSTDTIYLFVLFVIDIFCIIAALIRLKWLIKEREKQSHNIRKKNLNLHFWRFISHLFISILTFGFMFLSVSKLIGSLSAEIRDYIYIIICLIAEFFFSINYEFLRESLRILTCNKVDKFKKKDSEMELVKSEEEGAINLGNDIENDVDNYQN